MWFSFGFFLYQQLVDSKTVDPLTEFEASFGKMFVTWLGLQKSFGCDCKKLKVVRKLLQVFFVFCFHHRFRCCTTSINSFRDFICSFTHPNFPLSFYFSPFPISPRLSLGWRISFHYFVFMYYVVFVLSWWTWTKYYRVNYYFGLLLFQRSCSLLNTAIGFFLSTSAKIKSFSVAFVTC